METPIRPLPDLRVRIPAAGLLSPPPEEEEQPAVKLKGGGGQAAGFSRRGRRGAWEMEPSALGSIAGAEPVFLLSE